MGAALGGLLILPAPARGAKPEPGASFTVADHRTAGAGWHVEIGISRRHPGTVRTIVLFDERCGETVAAERIRLTPAGGLEAGGRFPATDAAGHEQRGSWQLRASFPTGHSVEGSFGISEPDCEASHTFSGEGGGHQHHGEPLDYADVAGATRRARGQARRMLRRVRAVAARRFPRIARARAAGFSRFMATDKIPEPGVFHLWSRAYNGDEAVLDPERPESLVYWKPSQAGAEPVLVAFMFRLHSGPRPRFAGSIPSWHTHKPGGDQMTHVWLAHGLRGAYANCLPVPELERALHAFTFEDVRYDGREAQPCAQGAG